MFNISKYWNLTVDKAYNIFFKWQTFTPYVQNKHEILLKSFPYAMLADKHDIDAGDYKMTW